MYELCDDDSVECKESWMEQEYGWNVYQLCDDYFEDFTERPFLQESWTEQDKLLKRDIAALKDRLVGLQTQNNTLHDELQKVGIFCTSSCLKSRVCSQLTSV